MGDSLIIGVDESKDKDHFCMTIARRQGRGYIILNELYDNEARKIYKKLINEKVIFMYEIVLLNEKGEKFTKEFNSEYLFRKYLNKYKRSKKLQVISYGRKY